MQFQEEGKGQADNVSRIHQVPTGEFINQPEKVSEAKTN